MCECVLYLWMNWFSSRYWQPRAISLAMFKRSTIVRLEGCSWEEKRKKESLKARKKSNSGILNRWSSSKTHMKTYGIIKDKTDQPSRGYKCVFVCVLTSLGLVSLRNVLRSPPAISSSRIKRGRACKLTPIHRTMFWWLNLLSKEIVVKNYIHNRNT